MIGGFKTRSLGKRHGTEAGRQDDSSGSCLPSSALGGPSGPMVGGATVAGTELCMVPSDQSWSSYCHC